MQNFTIASISHSILQLFTRVVLVIYERLLQHLGLPIAGSFNAALRSYKHQMRNENASLEDLTRLQHCKLCEIVGFAIESVPFYRERASDLRLSRKSLPLEIPLADFAPTTKQDVVDNFPDLITAQGADRSHWKLVSTTGTSRQVIGFQDRNKLYANRAARLRRQKLISGYPLGTRSLNMPAQMCDQQCGTSNGTSISLLQTANDLTKADLGRIRQTFVEFAYANRHYLTRNSTLRVFRHGDSGYSTQQINGFLNSIVQCHPTVLNSLPFYVHLLAKFILDQNIDIPNIPIVSPHGGSMTPLMRREIEQAFGCQVYDKYGSAELGEIGVDCCLHQGIHCFMDLFYIEFLRNGRPAQPGELGRLYVTDLENRAMPFIRYDVGDVGRFQIDNHGCGRNSIRFTVEGRVDETLINTSGVAFSPDTIYDFFHSQKEIDNFQLLEQQPSSFQLLCVPKSGASLSESTIEQRFQKFFDPNARLSLVFVKSIKAEPGGKFRFIKSSSYHAL